MNNRKNSVLELELEIMAIVFTLSGLSKFLVGDVTKFLLAFFLYFIPSMHIISVVVSDTEKFKELFSKQRFRRVLIFSILFTITGIMYRFIYSFDWLISGYAETSSAMGLMTATMLIVLILMDLKMDRPTLRRIIAIYGLVMTVIIPILLLGTWYYALYGVIEINKVSYASQSIYVYIFMLSGVSLLLFFDTDNRSYIYLKRSITSVVMIIFLVFMFFVLYGNVLYDINGMSNFGNVYEKATYVFKFANSHVLISLMSATSIVHYFILSIITATGIKYLSVLDYEFDSEKHKTPEEGLNDYRQHQTRKIITMFFVIAVIVEIVGIKSGLGEIAVSSFIAFIGMFMMNLVMCDFAIRTKFESTVVISALLVIVMTIIGMLSALMHLWH